MSIRRFISIVLVLLYCSVLGKVFVPWLSFQYNLEYAANTFCTYNKILKEKCDGVCFLHHSVEQHNQAEDKAEKHGNTAKADFSFYTIAEVAFPFVREPVLIRLFSFKDDPVQAFVPVLTQPPKIQA